MYRGGGIMRKTVVSVAAALSLALAVPVFAADEGQSSADTAASFERMKADHIKRLDDRIKSLQSERICAQGAKDQNELRACRMKHQSEMRGRSDDMRRKGGPGGPGGPMPPPSQ